MLTETKMLIFIFAFIFLHSSNGSLVNTPHCGEALPRLLFSQQEAGIGENPWVALIGYEDSELNKLVYACTGTLINPRYVLTSAACLLTEHVRQNSSLTHVRLGEHNIKTKKDCFSLLGECTDTTNAIDIRIEEGIPHPLYDTRGYNSDNIALLRLERTINLNATHDSFINPICLHDEGVNQQSILQERNAKLVGWDFGSGRPNDVLMNEFLTQAPDIECENFYRGFDPQRQICMINKTPYDRCIGDSGSPLVVHGQTGPPYSLVGVRSHGPFPCGSAESPIVFASVPYYREWIESVMKPF